MNKEQKKSRNKLLTQGKNPTNNSTNKKKFKLGRLKSQEDINQFIRFDIKTFQNKYTPINPSINQNILFKKNIRELNKKSISEIINKNKSSSNRPVNFINNNNTTKYSNRLYHHKGILIDQGNDIVARTVLSNNLYDDIKIRNIINFWNDLDVMESYRKYFFFIYKELGEEDKANLYHNEINELIQLKNDIKNLTYNIELRIGIIKKLSDLNDELNKKNESESVVQFIVNEMAKKLEDLTIQTVNIILYMKKIKAVINIIPNLGKYDFENIAQKFNFDKNYIIKMKFETNFLKAGVANKFFDFKNDKSPFVINAKDKSNYLSKNEQDKKVILLDQKIINDIVECNYYIYKELISYENEKANKKHLQRISPIRKKSAYNFYTNVNFYTNEFIKKQENKKEKLFLHINQNKNEFFNNDMYTNSKIKLKKDFFFDKKMNNSARNVKATDIFNQENSNVNNNENKNILNFNEKKKQIYSRKINKNNHFNNCHKKYDKNKLISPTINNSGTNMAKENADLNIKENIQVPNKVEHPPSDKREESKENKTASNIIEN